MASICETVQAVLRVHGIVMPLFKVLVMSVELIEFEGAAMWLPKGWTVRQFTIEDLREAVARLESLDAEERHRSEVSETRRDEQ